MTETPSAMQLASKEATDWLILLQEEPEDAGLRRRFDAWLHYSPANAAAWEATQRTSSVIEHTAPLHANRWKPFLIAARGPARSSAAPAGRPRVAVRNLGRRQVVGLGALAAACLLALWAAPDLLLSLQADYATGKGEIRSVQLADDSVVTLAPDSAIRVAYTPGERRIYLLTGEAFFDVTPAPERPFRVSAEAIDTVVLGTGFDVARNSRAATVAVEHGVVRVDYTAAVPPVSKTLTAGQALRVTWSGSVERSGASAGPVAAWRQRQLIAQDQALGEVVDRLRPYYFGTIIVTDDALAARPVTGVYNLTDPYHALRAIARAQNGVVRRVTPWILVVSTS